MSILHILKLVMSLRTSEDHFKGTDRQLMFVFVQMCVCVSVSERERANE